MFATVGFILRLPGHLGQIDPARVYSTAFRMLLPLPPERRAVEVAAAGRQNLFNDPNLLNSQKHHSDYKDQATADTICNHFECDGIKTWIAPRDIQLRSGWTECIIDGTISRRRFSISLSFSSFAIGAEMEQKEKAAQR
jgi:hypothetical protein